MKLGSQYRFIGILLVAGTTSCTTIENMHPDIAGRVEALSHDGEERGGKGLTNSRTRPKPLLIFNIRLVKVILCRFFARAETLCARRQSGMVQ